MTITVDVQVACAARQVPSAVEFRRWVRAALEGERETAQLTVRVVGEKEITALNTRYRHKHYATNVLSFPFEPIAGVMEDLLGDVVICRRVVAREAAQQGKEAKAHWAHLTVHGTLHLIGYDHETARDARRMEAREREILARLKFSDPYLD